MENIWPDFRALVRRPYDGRVWIPVGLHKSKDGIEYPQVGYRGEFEGVHSLMIPLANRGDGERYNWSDDHEHRPWASKNFYKPADAYWRDDEGDQLGIRLALRQTFPDRAPKWHLHQDFVIALGLAFENNVWLRPSENYTEVARLVFNNEGDDSGIEVKSEFLGDYLRARESILRICTFRSLDMIFDSSHVPPEFADGEEEDFANGRLQFRSMKLDDNGNPAGSTVAVFKASRTDVDPDDDVPQMGPETSANRASDSWTFTRPDGQNERLMADFWRNEWIEPAAASLRVRMDDIRSDVTFIVSADGQRVNADDLDNEDIGRWLWFKPDVIPSIISRRGARISWYSRDTGGVSTPSDPSVHFGLNENGLLTVYAGDVARLPEWERRLWAGFNITPSGGVSRELLMSQVEVEPASTHAPEKFLPLVLEQFNNAWCERFNENILRAHDHVPEITARCHRFRSLDRNGLYSLAKDVARITADLIDPKIAQKVVQPPKGEQWGSLKSLERALGSICPDTFARKITSPLFAAYDLRLSDAHLPKSDVQKALEILGIQEDDAPIVAGFKMLYMVVSSIDACRRVISSKLPAA